MKRYLKKHRKEIMFILVFSLMLIGLSLLPTGFEKQIYQNAEGVKAEVLSCHNGNAQIIGLAPTGEQSCEIKLKTGSHKDEIVTGLNLFTGSVSTDKIFEEGDIAWVLVEQNKAGEIIHTNMIDYYRLDAAAMLICLFVLCLIVFSGFTGIRTVLSFAFALLSIWKLLIPLMLKGYDPLILGLIIGNLLTVVTLFLVAGLTKKAVISILSAMTCSFMTTLLALVFTNLFHIHGAVMEGSEALLYAGFGHLDFTKVFQAGIYLACSGAILDLAIDIAAALEEVVKANSNISQKALIQSGLTIGKSVVGSQTTTLLLAYMGSYLTIMMVYIAQGTPLLNILNSAQIAAEILHTFVGCIGLVLVSPLTSLISGIIYTRKENSWPLFQR